MTKNGIISKIIRDLDSLLHRYAGLIQDRFMANVNVAEVKSKRTTILKFSRSPEKVIPWKLPSTASYPHPDKHNYRKVSLGEIWWKLCEQYPFEIFRSKFCKVHQMTPSSKNQPWNVPRKLILQYRDSKIFINFVLRLKILQLDILVVIGMTVS